MFACLIVFFCFFSFRVFSFSLELLFSPLSVYLYLSLFCCVAVRCVVFGCVVFCSVVLCCVCVLLCCVVLCGVLFCFLILILFWFDFDFVVVAFDCVLFFVCV